MAFDYNNEDLDLHTEGFNATVNMAPQNTLNRLLPAVRANFSPPAGDYFDDDFMAPLNWRPKGAFNAPTPEGHIQTVKRVGMYKQDNASAWINNVSQLHGLSDPTSGIMQSIEAGKQRLFQAEILRALDGEAYQYKVDKSGALTTRAPVAVAWDTANDIAVDLAVKHQAETVAVSGNQNITLGKINRAATLLDKAQLVGEGKRYFIIDSDGMEALMLKIPVTSADYMKAQAIMTNRCGNLYGFEFIVLPEAMTHSGTVRKYFAVDSRAVMFCARPIVGARVKPRPDRSDALQAYAAVENGAARMVDAGVKRVLCDLSI